MILIACYGQREEIDWLKNAVARVAIEKNLYNCGLQPITAEKQIETMEAHPDIFVCSIREKRDIEVLKTVRQCHPDADIVPIADSTIPPMLYVRPDIRPAGVLWRPMERKVNWVSLHELLRKSDTIYDEERFVVNMKRESISVPVGDIIYFEARDKKIIVRLKREELMYYDTLSRLEKVLPAIFFRCHKGYLVNSKYIRRVDWRKHMLHVGMSQMIPVSKANWSKIREMFYDSE